MWAAMDVEVSNLIVDDPQTLDEIFRAMIELNEDGCRLVLLWMENTSSSV